MKIPRPPAFFRRTGEVFGKNLEQLLMQPPIAGQVVLGWDPAFRTGCRLYLQKAGYSQNRVSDAMSFSAIITPLEGLEFVGEMSKLPSSVR